MKRARSGSRFGWLRPFSLAAGLSLAEVVAAHMAPGLMAQQPGARLGQPVDVMVMPTLQVASQDKEALPPPRVVLPQTLPESKNGTAPQTVVEETQSKTVPISLDT